MTFLILKLNLKGETGVNLSLQDVYGVDGVEHGGSSDLQGYEEIDCHINGEYSIGCRKEGGEIYLPFSFLHKYFEVCYVQRTASVV
jgi:hypothetical protein